MPHLTTLEFQQKIRDGESLGIPRATTFQQLKAKGYTIGGEPPPPGPTPENSGGVLGYFGATLKNAVNELGAFGKGTLHYATNPAEAVGLGRDVIAGSARMAVGAGEGLYRAATGNTPPEFHPDGTITYPESGLTGNMEVTKGFLESGANAVKHPLQTFRDHPLQTAATIAPVAGMAGKAAQAGKFGTTVQKAAQMTKEAGGAVKSFVKGAPSTFKNEAVGAMTGAGGGATKIASQADSFGSVFHQGMRGDSLEQARVLAADAQKGISMLKKKRSAEYLKTNEAMRSIMEPLDEAPVRQLLSETMGEFRITESEKGLLDAMKNMDDQQAGQYLQQLMARPDGGSDLSPLVKAGIGDGPAASKIGKAIHYVENWDDFTPDGLDKLQKSLNSLDPKPGSVESAFITKMKRGVQQTVKDKYPEYSKMLATYNEASDHIEELQMAIGSSNRPNIETTVRKMSQSMKTGNQGHEIRNAVLAELEQATGVKIRERVAGMAMKSAWPRGLPGVGAGLGATAVVGQLISPSFLIGVAMSSPRVAGEVLSALGVAKKHIAPLYAKLKTIMPPSTTLSVGAGLDALNNATNPD